MEKTWKKNIYSKKQSPRTEPDDPIRVQTRRRHGGRVKLRLPNTCDDDDDDKVIDILVRSLVRRIPRMFFGNPYTHPLNSSTIFRQRYPKGRFYVQILVVEKNFFCRAYFARVEHCFFAERSESIRNANYRSYILETTFFFNTYFFFLLRIFYFKTTNTRILIVVREYNTAVVPVVTCCLLLW